MYSSTPMVKKLSGYCLAGIGLLGFIYFKSYKGNTIPLPILWIILSLVIAAIGAYLIVSARLNKQVEKSTESSAKLSRIKENGERILIDLDNCEFKTSSIAQLNTESFSRIQMIDALYDPNRNHVENNSTVTYIIYKHKTGDTIEKFVSKPFPIDDTTLKYYISQNKIVLYVDRFDRAKYFFTAE
jgi:ABC-type transport system involved in multi-copper enzyme maturation permease subunit